MPAYWISQARLPTGWQDAVRIDCDDQGRIEAVTPGGPKAGAECFLGAALPAPSNVHSHAFQRAMAGLAELSNGGRDDFWSWRERMYAFLARLDPDDLQAIAAQTYLEMLKGGYGAVAEFHYIHRTPEGGWYQDKAACARAVAAGAATAGLDIVFAPCVYLTAGFDGAPLQPRQKRFEAGPDDIADIRAALQRDGVKSALALHSLRAVPADRITEALTAYPEGPVHMHIAEQLGEVEACIAATGRRPVERLLDLTAVDSRWCLVHATHMTPEETWRLSRSGAVAGLCPTTEGNLGDGLFDFPGLDAHGGAFGVGTDSHVTLEVAEELRWLDYGWRLRQHRRFAEGRAGHRGADLWMRAAAGGARALGEDHWGIERGARANFVVVDGEHASLVGRQGDALIDSLVFCRHGDSPIKTVISKGVPVVRNGHHAAEEQVAEAYRQTLRKLVA